MANTNDIANALEKLGATVDRANFATKMQDQDFAERVRTSLEGAGASVPDSATFYNKYGVNRVTQAKDQYAQDVATQNLNKIEAYKQENPNISALFPISSENVATGDRGVFSNLVGAVKDVSAFPGRALNAAVGLTAENAANAIYGPRDTDTQLQLAKEALGNARSRLGQYVAPTEAGLGEGIAQNLITDPYAIPLAAVGGPIAGKIAGSTLGALGKFGASVGVDAATNAAIGAVERGTSTNPEQRAFDVKQMGLDALIGGAPTGLMHGLGAVGGRLLNRTKSDLGEEVIASTPRKVRDDLVYAFDPAGDKDKAASAIGEYLTTTEKGKYTQVSRNPFKKSAPENIMENVVQKQQTATKGLDEQYAKLDKEFDAAVREDKFIRKPQGIDAQGNILNLEGNPVGTGYLGADPQNVRNYGVPLNEILDKAVFEMTLEGKKAYDIPAIKLAKEAILERFNQYNMYDGVIAPSTARDLKKRIYADITDSPRKTDLDDFYKTVYKSINEHVSKLEHGATEKLFQNVQTGEIVRESSIKDFKIKDFEKYRPVEGVVIGEENLVSAKNEATRKALSLGEGLERSRYFNPQARQTQLGDAADVAKLALATSSPVALAASIGKLPGGKRLVAQELSGALKPLAIGATRIAESRAVQGRNAQPDTRKEESVQFAQIADRLTETEFNTLKNIMALRPNRRTPEQNAFLQKYLSK